MSHHHEEFRRSHCSPEQKIYHHRKPINGQSSNCLVTRVNSFSFSINIYCSQFINEKPKLFSFQRYENDDRVMKTSRY